MGASTDGGQSQAYIFLPKQASPPIPVAGTVGAAAIYCNSVSGLLQSTNGAAYSALGGGGGGGSLDASYLLGSTINITDGIGPVNLVTSAVTTGGGALLITAAPGMTLAAPFVAQTIDMGGAVPGANALTGLSITMATTTPGTASIIGLEVIGAPTTKAKWSGAAVGAYGLMALRGRAQSQPILTATVRNTSAVAGSLMFLGWDSTNFNGTPATSTILTGQTHMVTLDGQTNVDAATNNVEFVGLRILVPSTTSTAAVSVRLAGAVTSVGLEMTSGSSLAVSAANEGRLRYNSGTQVWQISANGVAYQDIAVIGSAATVTLQNAYAGGRTITVTDATGSVEFISTQVSGSIFKINSAATLAGTLTGINYDLSSVVPGTQVINAFTITTPETASSATSSALKITAPIRAGALIDVTMSATGSAFTPYGVEVTMSGAGVGDGAAGFLALGLTNAGHRHFWSTSYQQSPVNGYTMFYGNWNPGAGGSGNPFPVGVRINFTPTSPSNTQLYTTTSGKGFWFESFPTAPNNGGTEGGFITYNVYGVYIDHTPVIGSAATITTDNFNALFFTVNPASNGTKNVKGISGTMGANSSATSFAADLAWQGLAGATNGIVRIALDRNATSTGGALVLLKLGSKTATYDLANHTSTIGIDCDLATNFTAGANAQKCAVFTMGASAVAGTRVLVLTSTQTGAASSALEIAQTPGSSASVIGASITMGANATGAALTIAHSGTNANQLVFTSVPDGTGSHIYGPTGGILTIKAGIRTNAGIGRGIEIYAASGVTSGAGGTISLYGGSGIAGTDNGGAIVLTGGNPVSTGSYGYIRLATSWAEAVQALSDTGATTVTLDLSKASVITVKVTGAVTWVFSNPVATASFASTFTMVIQNGGAFAQTWPASVKWPGAVQPTWTVSGFDVVVFVTTDNGTTYRGAQVQADSR